MTLQLESVGTDEQRWYAIWTRARHEKKVRDHLQRRGIETLLPIWKRLSQWQDRRKVIEEPLFPGYCIAHLSSTEIRAVLMTPGVVDIVRHQGRIAPIPEEEIYALSTLAKCGFPCRPHPFPEGGAWVEVIRGSTKGVKGILLSHDRYAQLVVVVMLIHQAATIKIDVADVTFLTEPPRHEPHAAVR